jgi:hypothetical protein
VRNAWREASPASNAYHPGARAGRFVGQVLQNGFDFNILTVCIGVSVGNFVANQNDG